MMWKTQSMQEQNKTQVALKACSWQCCGLCFEKRNALKQATAGFHHSCYSSLNLCTEKILNIFFPYLGVDSFPRLSCGDVVMFWSFLYRAAGRKKEFYPGVFLWTFFCWKLLWNPLRLLVKNTKSHLCADKGEFCFKWHLFNIISKRSK